MPEDLKNAALDYHRHPKPGKLEIKATKPLANQRDLALAYSPGVAAACREIEQALKARMNIPMFHDDQHGAAIVVSAAILNGLRVVRKDTSPLAARTTPTRSTTCYAFLSCFVAPWTVARLKSTRP